MKITRTNRVNKRKRHGFVQESFTTCLQADRRAEVLAAQGVRVLNVNYTQTFSYVSYREP